MKIEQISAVRKYTDTVIYYVDIGFELFEEYSKSIVILSYANDVEDICIFSFTRQFRFEFKEEEKANRFFKKLFFLAFGVEYGTK